MIVVESKRKKPATLLKKYPNVILADVTSGAKDGRGADNGIKTSRRGCEGVKRIKETLP